MGRLRGFAGRRSREVGLREFLLGLALFVFPVIASHAENLADLSDETLIDRLADADTFGFNNEEFSAFVSDDSTADKLARFLGHPPPTTPPVMRELVRRGVTAMPKLIAHLGDGRLTKLAAGNSKEGSSQSGIFYTFMSFSTEYDPRHLLKRRERLPFSFSALKKDDFFNGMYQVKIGDLCYFLIGRIVGRGLYPVRYQPTLGLIVNSPIQKSVLAEWTKADWGDLTAHGLKDSLLEDIYSSSDAEVFEPAMSRLRFYFPDVYRDLSGAGARRKTVFEQDGK
jgi:hypothetical protein